MDVTDASSETGRASIRSAAAAACEACRRMKVSTRLEHQNLPAMELTALTDEMHSTGQK